MSWACNICGCTEKYARNDGQTGGCKKCAQVRSAAARIVSPEAVKAVKAVCYDATSAKLGRKKRVPMDGCKVCSSPKAEGYCKGMCRSCYDKTRYAEDPEPFKARARNNSKRPGVKEKEKQRKLDNPTHSMFHQAKKRAKAEGIPFTISKDDITIPEVCPILRIPLVRGIGRTNRNSPSLDRIIPRLGYVPGNIQVISYKANTMKNDASSAELRLFAEWVLATNLLAAA